MDRNLFLAGIKELEICLNLTVKKDVLKGWYINLKAYSEYSFRQAIFYMIDNDIKPSYVGLLKSIQKFKQQEFKDYIKWDKGGQAEHTPELKSLSGKYMKLLVESLNNKTIKQIKEKLKKDWVFQYEQLPNYHNRWQIQGYIDNRDIEKLTSLGLFRRDEWDKSNSHNKNRLFSSEVGQEKQKDFDGTYETIY